MPAGDRQLPLITKRDRPAARAVEHDVVGKFGQQFPPRPADAAAVAFNHSHASPRFLKILDFASGVRLVPDALDPSL
jgi:hypothetical protein